VQYEVSFTALVGVCLMAVLMMSRHTRAEEESGRSELLRGTVVGRHAAGLAARSTTIGSCVLLGLLLAAVLVTTALTLTESMLFGASVAAAGTVFAAVTLCLAQVYLHSRTVTGAALAVFAATYACRAAGDVTESWLVWLSPMGWAQAVHVPPQTDGGPCSSRSWLRSASRSRRADWRRHGTSALGWSLSDLGRCRRAARCPDRSASVGGFDADRWQAGRQGCSASEPSPVPWEPQSRTRSRRTRRWSTTSRRRPERPCWTPTWPRWR
jgi:hypothetical protein